MGTFDRADQTTTTLAASASTEFNKQALRLINRRRSIIMSIIKIVAACGAVLSSMAAAEAQGIDWAKVDAALGRSPAAVAGAVHLGSRAQICR
jgi:hypothetical protein